MAAQKKKPYLTFEERRVRLAVRVVWAYYLALLGVVLLTLFTGVVSYWQQLDLPFGWYAVVKFTFYGLPLALAVLYGLLFKPFLSGVRNILVPVVVVHGLYSIGIFGLRMVYLENLREDSYRSRMLPVAVYNSRHRLLDNSKDGQIDLFQFGTMLDTDGIEPGEYYVAASVTQRGQEFPNSQIGRYPFQIFPVEQKPIKLQFQTNPQVFEPYYESGIFEVNLRFHRILPVEQPGKILMAFSRWSPFLRFTDWEGHDPVLESVEVEIVELKKVDAFHLMPLKLQEPQVFLTGFIEDYPVDQDSDGLYDYLVLSLPLRSEYEGPLFVQTTLQNASYPLFYEGWVVLGANTFEVMVEAPYIQEAGGEGPFEFKDFQIFNRNPQCPGGECRPLIKPYFKLYLDDYITSRYRLEQFER